LANHKNDKDGGAKARLACRARRLSSKTLGSDTDITLDHVQSFLDFIQTILQRITADWLHLSRSDVLLLFVLILQNGGGTLMNFGYVSSVINFKNFCKQLLQYHGSNFFVLNQN